MAQRTRITLGRREDLGADCSNCFGLCCVALAFARSADFPVDKPAGEACTHLDAHDGCSIHAELRPSGYKGCTVFDCFGAGQKVSHHTLASHSWRDGPTTRSAMLTAFPVVRRLHELLWYLDEAIALVADVRDPAPWVVAFERVQARSNLSAAELEALDVDREYDDARPLLVEASEIARAGVVTAADRHRGRRLQPGSDLLGADLRGADLSGLTLRGSLAIGADLRAATLASCDVLGVDLRDADLRGADLGTAIFLTQMQVNSARGDAGTVLPPGFDRPGHWTVTVTSS